MGIHCDLYRIAFQRTASKRVTCNKKWGLTRFQSLMYLSLNEAWCGITSKSFVYASWATVSWVVQCNQY